MPSTTSGGADWASVDSGGENQSFNDPFTITGLLRDCEYTCAVIAVNVPRLSETSDSVNATT